MTSSQLFCLDCSISITTTTTKKKKRQTKNTYYNLFKFHSAGVCLTPRFYYEIENKNLLLLCDTGIYIRRTLLRRLDQQPGSDFGRLPHVVWLLGFSSGLVCRPYDPLESYQDILLWVKLGNICYGFGSIIWQIKNKQTDFLKCTFPKKVWPCRNTLWIHQWPVPDGHSFFCLRWIDHPFVGSS